MRILHVFRKTAPLVETGGAVVSACTWIRLPARKAA